MEAAALTADQVRAVVVARRESAIYPHVVVLLATGSRRGEPMGLRWGDVDLEAGMLRIQRAVEKTRAKVLR